MGKEGGVTENHHVVLLPRNTGKSGTSPRGNEGTVNPSVMSI